MATRGFTNNRKNCSKMNERIENTYTRSGRIANPTEQDEIVKELGGE